MALSTLNVRQPTKPIVYLDTIASITDAEGDTSIELLAVHEDGEVSCYTETLDREIWAARGILDNHSSDSTRVEYAFTISLEEAQKALLKGREDILESLRGPDDFKAVKLLLLLTVSAKSNTLTFRLFRLNQSLTNFRESSVRKDAAVQEILSVLIPGSSGRDKNGIQTTFHVQSGIVYQHTSSTLTTYDMSGCIPRAGHRISLGTGEMSSCVRISTSLISMANNNSISVLDLRYSSCQGQLTLPKRKKTRRAIGAVKDDKADATQSEGLVLLSYNSHLDVVIALQGQELKAFQLATSMLRNDGYRKRKHDGLLVDSIGRGTAARKRRALSAKPTNGSFYKGFSFISENLNDQWKEQRNLVNQCLANGDMQEVERLLSLDTDCQAQVDAPMSDATRTKHHRRKIQYAISKILEVDDDGRLATTKADGTTKRLKVAQSVKNIPDLLFSQCRLSDYQVEVAFKHEGLISGSDRINLGSVAQALAQWDMSLRTLLAYVDGLSPRTALDIIHVLQYAIAKVGPSCSTNGMKLLTYGENLGGDKSQEIEVHNPSSQSDTNAPRIQSDDDNVTERILKTALRKLYACPALEVSNALRSILSRSEIRLLVDMLRVQLARNGWLTLYDEQGFHAKIQERPGDSQISLIAHLLSCAVDSVGTGGWIMGGSIADDLNETAETIAYMKAEISAALEGVEEATYLKGMLGEMLLCSKSCKSKYPNAYRQRQLKAPHERMQSTIVSLDVAEDHRLPLGLKLQQDISKHKVGAGGELIKRSARDMGRLKSRLVPKYSFERIMI